MIEFDVDMGYLLEEGELDRVVLNDENCEHEPMEFRPSAEREAATIGGGRLTAEQVPDAHDRHWHDLPAEYDMPEASALSEYCHDWQAIADELNAALGGGECEMEYGGDVTEDTARVMDVYFCSECGSPNYNDCMPHHCIYCGKAVKR